jgi:hypothetical protein
MSWPDLRLCPFIFLGALKKATKNIRISQYLGLNLNRAPPEALPTHSMHTKGFVNQSILSSCRNENILGLEMSRRKLLSVAVACVKVRHAEFLYAVAFLECGVYL